MCDITFNPPPGCQDHDNHTQIINSGIKRLLTDFPQLYDSVKSIPVRRIKTISVCGIEPFMNNEKAYQVRIGMMNGEELFLLEIQEVGQPTYLQILQSHKQNRKRFMTQYEFETLRYLESIPYEGISLKNKRRPPKSRRKYKLC